MCLDLFSKKNKKPKIHLHFNRDSDLHHRHIHFHEYDQRYGWEPSYEYDLIYKKIPISIYENDNEPIRKYDYYHDPKKAGKTGYYNYY